MSKVALVTGARRGIGQASAVALARLGMDVVLCDVTDEAAATEQAIAAAGQRSFYQRCDVGVRAQVESLFAAAVERFGRVDAVVNNAAINIRKPLVDLEVEDVERVWAVSLWGVFHSSQLGARQMIRQGDGGSIVMISSVHADRAFAGSTAYNGAKAAVNQMAKTWAVELAPSRIRVNAIEPGWTDTPGERTFYSEDQIVEEGRKLPLGRLGKPEEIADAVAFLVSEKASYITGSILRVDGGIVLPR